MLRASSNSKTWKETKFPGRWLNNLGYISSIENYIPIKMINEKTLWQHERHIANNVLGCSGTLVYTYVLMAKK